MTRHVVPKVGLLVVALTAAVAACGCGGSSSGGASGGPGDAGSDGAHPRDGAAADHAVTDSAPGPDAASGDDAAADAAPDGGPTCAPPTSRGAACAACVASNCESAWCSCMADTANIDDAGNSGCVRYVDCAEQCVASDAGTPTDCLQKICSGIPFSPIEEHEGQTLVGCLVAYCAADCVN